MSWLSDNEICEKVRRNANRKTKTAFLGVSPIDKLPKSIPLLPVFIVVNTHTHNLQGQHWKTIFIDKNRHGEVFDSLALPMSDILIRWMNRFTKTWKTNRKVYQHAKSTTCGSFALYFILKRLDYPSLYAFTQNFSYSLNKNEQLVRHFYGLLK